MKYLDHLFRDSVFVELRHHNNGWKTYWFDNPVALRTKARQLADRGNLFTSLNHVPEIPDGPVKNEHVTRHSRGLFDLDPKRPAGTSSTDGELAFAKKAADRLQKALRAWGWPEPLTAMSGNGCHLQYRVALVNDEATKQMLKVIYRGMKAEFSDALVDFDTSVKSAGQICTLYGTTKRKGDNTENRPHRRSTVEIPDPWKQVRPKQVEAVANFYARQTPTAEVYRPVIKRTVTERGDYHTLDIVGWFTAHGLYEHHIEDNIHAVICPWESEHSETNHNDTIIFETKGDWPGFFCHHSHCADRDINAVMQVLGDADVFVAQDWRAKS